MTGLIWNADPVAVTLGGLQLRWYGVLFTGGLLLAAHRGAALVRQVGVPAGEVDLLFTWVVAGVVIGARVGHVLFYQPGRYLVDPLAILAVWQGGLASHGGVIGLAVGVAAYARGRALPLLPVLDAVAVVAPLSGAAIRVGNFMNSEIIGRPTTLPWAVTFARVDLVPRHPAQLYEAASYAAIGLLLWRSVRSRAGVCPGLLLGLSLVLVFSVRFALEFLKEPQIAAEAAWPLNLGQLLSLPAIIVGVVLMVRALRRAP